MSIKACRRCGRCCYLYILPFQVKIKCKYMVHIGKYHHCRIYNHKGRLNKILWDIGGHKFFCALREKSPFDFPGCPYNTNKPMIEDDLTVWYQSYKQFMDDEIRRF